MERTATDPIGKTRILFAGPERHLVGVELEKYRAEALMQIELPDYRERVRVPFVTQAGDTLHSTDLFFSSDRKVAAYSFEDIVVCRRTEDLEVLWTQRISPRLTGAKRLAVSVDGSVVGVAVAGQGPPYREYYIGLYDGRNGTELGRLPICGGYGMGISPDGKLLAVGDRVRDGAEMAVHIHELPSGRLVTSLEHGKVASGHLQFLRSLFEYNGIQFTSDGKYLIVSGGYHIKVWSLPANLLLL